LQFSLDYSVLILITGVFGGLGILEGYYIDPAFYSQALIIFVMFAYFVYRDIHKMPEPPVFWAREHTPGCKKDLGQRRTRENPLFISFWNLRERSKDGVYEFQDDLLYYKASNGSRFGKAYRGSLSACKIAILIQKANSFSCPVWLPHLFSPLPYSYGRFRRCEL
jgi:hypothetical protein